MKDAEFDILPALNGILHLALTGINQYFLHARILKHQGFMKLADHEYKESIHEMRQADQLVERILALGGTPRLKQIGTLAIENEAEAILRADLALEQRAHAMLSPARGAADEETRRLLEAMHTNGQAHIAFLAAQLELCESLGADAYLQTQR